MKSFFFFFFFWIAPWGLWDFSSPTRNGTLRTLATRLSGKSFFEVLNCYLSPPWHCSWAEPSSILHQFSLWTYVYAQSRPTLCNPRDCIPSSSSVHGIFQARILEWICLFLLQWIFLTQGSNPRLLCLLHWPVDSLSLAPAGKPLDVRTGSKLIIVPS